MTRLRSIFATLLFLVASETQALSCAPLQFDAAAIEKLEIIFEGLVEEKQSPSVWRRIKRAIGYGSHSNDSRDSNPDIYIFKVTRLWKGTPVEGERVEILASPGWGQQAAYQVGKAYLVFGEIGDEAGTYKSRPGWCGFDLLPREEVMLVLEQYLSRRNPTVRKRKNAGQPALRNASELPE